MKDRISHSFSDRVEVERRFQTGTNEIGEPIYERETVGTFDCDILFESTDFIRRETGERVTQVPIIKFRAGVDVEEGDTIKDTPDGFADTYEVKSLEKIRDRIRVRVIYLRCEMESV